MLAHGIESQIVDAAHFLLVPLVDVTAEYDAGVPFLELVEQEESLLTGESGGKLHRRGAENVGVAEDKGVTDAYVVLLQLFSFEKVIFYQLHLLSAKRSAGRVKEEIAVENPLAVGLLNQHKHPVERRVEEARPQRPSVVRDVVIAHHGIERQRDVGHIHVPFASGRVYEAG